MPICKPFQRIGDFRSQIGSQRPRSIANALEEFSLGGAMARLGLARPDVLRPVEPPIASVLAEQHDSLAGLILRRRVRDLAYVRRVAPEVPAPVVCDRLHVDELPPGWKPDPGKSN